MEMNEMAGKTLEEILSVEAASGPFGTGDAVIEQTLRDFIQLQSTTIAVGTNVVGVRSVSWMDFKWYTGVNGSFSYPLDDNAVVDPTKIGTESYSAKLFKGQGRVTFLDSVRLRGESWENIDRQQLGIVRARADKIDATILAALVAGAGQTQAATAAFGAATADEEGDLLAAMDLIFANARVSGDEPMALILPANKRSAMLNTQLFGNVVESLQDHMGRIANLRVYYSRDSSVASDALLLIPGSETAEFFQYNGEGFMETELTRLPGVGYDWLLTSFMGTVVHEHQDGAASGKNMRICKITGVA
jgi:hypothetical protein